MRNKKLKKNKGKFYENNKKFFLVFGVFLFLLVGIFLIYNFFDEGLFKFSEEISFEDSGSLIVEAIEISRSKDVVREKIENSQEDLYYSYDKKKKELSLEDNEKIIWRAKLLTPYENKISVGGPDTLVAELYLEDFDENSMNRLFEDYTLYDINRNYEKIERNLTFKYSVEKEIEKCRINFEGIEECGKSILTEWKEFDNLEEVPKGIRVGIFVDTYLGDYIEWIPRIKGKDFYQWAAWDISSAVYDGISIDTQDSASQGIFFKSDGTKLYEIGTNGDKIYQYSCSTAWSLSSCSYDSVSISTQSSYPSGIFFKSDGTKMYELSGESSGYIYEYSLSTAWSLSSATYQQSKAISGLSSYPRELFFNSAGTKVYISSTSFSNLREYPLSTAWDVSTIGSTSGSLSLEGLNPNGIFFKSDGTALYAVSSDNDATIHQYSLSTAWSLNSASYTGNSVSISDSFGEGISFKSDGTKFYLVDSDSDKIYQFSLSSSFGQNLQIISPTSADPILVKGGDSVIAFFNYTDGNGNLVTSGLSLDFVRVASSTATVNSFSHVSGQGWRVNFTAPMGLSGPKDLTIKAVYSLIASSDTQSNTILYRSVLMNEVEILPSLPGPSNDLEGFCKGTDEGSSEDLNYHYKWYKNGTEYSSGYNSTNFTSGVKVLVNTLSNSLTSEGESWILSCLATNGLDNSTWMNSSSVQITDIPSMNILTPNYLDPVYVEDGQNISIYFYASEFGSEITSGIFVEKVLIGGEEVLINSKSSEKVFPNILSVTETVFSTDTTTHNVDMPSSTSSGDLLLVLFTSDGSATVTTPSGWTLVNTTSYSSYVRGSVYAKISNGEEGGTSVNFITSANEQAAAQVYRISAGSWHGNISEGISIQPTSGSGTNSPNPPSLTTSWGSDKNLWISYAAGSSWTSVNSYPSNYIDGIHSISNTGTAGASASSAIRKLETETENPGAFSMSSQGSGIPFTIAVRGGYPRTEYITGQGWQVNVTVPSGFSGYYNLSVDVFYLNLSMSDTEIDSVVYAYCPFLDGKKFEIKDSQGETCFEVNESGYAIFYGKVEESCSLSLPSFPEKYFNLEDKSGNSLLWIRESDCYSCLKGSLYESQTISKSGMDKSFFIQNKNGTYLTKIDFSTGNAYFLGEVCSGGIRFNLNEGLISLWEFEESSGTVTSDEKGNYEGNIVGVTIGQAGKVGNSFYFDGVNDLVEFDTSFDNGLNPLYEHSISAWIKRSGSAGGLAGLGTILSRFYLSDSELRNYFFGLGNDHSLLATYYDNTTAITSISYLPPSPGQNIWTGNWVHVVYTRNESVIKLYVNGNLVNSTSGGNGIQMQSEDALVQDLIGARSGGFGGAPNDFFNGSIDQVAVWNRSLSLFEVKRIYNLGNGFNYSNW